MAPRPPPPRQVTKHYPQTGLNMFLAARPRAVAARLSRSSENVKWRRLPVKKGDSVEVEVSGMAKAWRAGGDVAVWRRLAWWCSGMLVWGGVIVVVRRLGDTPFLLPATLPHTSSYLHSIPPLCRLRRKVRPTGDLHTYR